MLMPGTWASWNDKGALTLEEAEKEVRRMLCEEDPACWGWGWG